MNLLSHVTTERVVGIHKLIIEPKHHNIIVPIKIFLWLYYKSNISQQQEPTTASNYYETIFGTPSSSDNKLVKLMTLKYKRDNIYKNNRKLNNSDAHLHCEVFMHAWPHN